MKNANNKSARAPVDPEIVREIIDISLAMDEQAMLDKGKQNYWKIKLFSDPTLVGAENLPKGPAVYIGNHSAMALDVIVLSAVLEKASGQVIRGMSDQVMYKNPKVRKFVASHRGIMGNQEIGDAMLENGKPLFVFPGGSFEATKGIKERYQLKWKQRAGFVSLAAKHGVPIVPVAIVGPDEWFGRYIDKGEMKNSKLGKLLSRLGVSEQVLDSDLNPGIPKGLLGTLIPKPQKVYIAIGEPVDTGSYKGKTLDQSQQWALREQAKSRLEKGISDMLILQAQERESLSLMRRLLTM